MRESGGFPQAATKEDGMDTSTNVASTMAMIRHSLEKVTERDEIMSFIQQ